MCANYKWTNSYTRILDDGNGSFQNKQKKLDEISLSKSHSYYRDKRNRRPQDQNRIYTRFVNDLFKERQIISKREFNKLIVKHFNSSSTWYRRRMIDIGLIIESHGVIRKNINSDNHEEK